MSPRVLLTGATGYIGGTVLDTLVSTHPDYDVTVLLRNVPENFRSTYPNVKIVNGHFDSTDIIADAASQADIVIHHGLPLHDASLNALITGLLRRSEQSFLIRLSGSVMASDFMEEARLGSLNQKTWSDLYDVDTIASERPNALVDSGGVIVRTAAAEHGKKLKVAIIVPPATYGPGRGLGRTQSIPLPRYVIEAKKLGAAFYYGDGTNSQGWVHIEDLAKLYMKLVEAAAAGGGSATWGEKGFYFTSSQEVSQLNIARAAAKILKREGVVESDEPKQISLDELDGMLVNYRFPFASRYMFASNSRSKADRAKCDLEWKPDAPGLLEVIEPDLLEALRNPQPC
ncbi:NAD(P)-binding protein [Polyplosphaeria fusca]|uniref:NAD(P)-binding protein n=1 Tax=Polyplosphaeria fusca TaxID=682080 RepID=A0A9P4V4Z1_9PLEO|nr:NAD(P)-binding protein [Polyplosphaeria fusca]